jgi:hypothetical protein
MVSACAESHEQDGERLSRETASCGVQQRPAILPWRFEPAWRGRRPHAVIPLSKSGDAVRRRGKQRLHINADASRTRGVK